MWWILCFPGGLLLLLISYYGFMHRLKVQVRYGCTLKGCGGKLFCYFVSIGSSPHRYVLKCYRCGGKLRLSKGFGRAILKYAPPRKAGYTLFDNDDTGCHLAQTSLRYFIKESP